VKRTAHDDKLHIPTSSEIMWEGLLDALCFIFGCVLWLLACSQFLHKYGSESREVDTIILCFPVIFGPGKCMLELEDAGENLTVSIFTLNLTSTVLCIKHRSDTPQLSSLEPTIGELVPSVSPELREHTLYVDIMRRALSIEASMDDKQTTFLDVSITGDPDPPQESKFETGNMRSTKVRLHRAHSAYPTRVAISAKTPIQEEQYRLQVVQVTTILRTLLLTGVTSTGLQYHRCILGNWLDHGEIALPVDLRRLQIEIAFSNIPYGIPFNSPLTDRFSTVYLPMKQGKCQQYCTQQRGCFESRITSTNGCFFIFGPTSLTCEQLHKEDKQAEESPYSFNLMAELCSGNGGSCVYLKKGSPYHLVSDMLDASLSYG
ncbi:tauD, partial [Symbiodinium pilosum]